MTDLACYVVEQQKICERFGAAFDPPPLRSKVGFALESVGKVPLNGIRSPAVGDTNGWYLWFGEQSFADDFFKPLHTEHLIERCPLALPFLALPPGWGFITDTAGYVDVWFDPQFLEP